MDFTQLIINQAANALDEDVGSGDISADLIDESAHTNTELLLRRRSNPLWNRLVR